MDCRNFAIFLSPLKPYPLKLAAKIGLERAVYWFELYQKYGECTFEYVETIPILLGISKPRDVFDSLVNLGYIERNESGSFGLSFEKMFDATDGASLSSEIKPPFTDSRFITLINNYINLLKEKGRRVDKRSLYRQFDNHSLDESLQALKTATNNRWVTLFFNDPDKRRPNSVNEGNKGRGNTQAGGGTNKDRAGNFSVEEI